MNLTLFYDHDPDGSKRPLWLSVNAHNVNWEESTHYVDCSSYDTCDVYNFFDDLYGLSILLDELVINEYPSQFGINIEKVKTRVGEQLDLTSIERFMVQVVDVVEVLNVTL